ncbi:MAG: hypothetical protein GVY19_07800 [Bacteroidetes bacterium]|jgi:hypothetical protein|nr:hypothetical protein [Bacteroidota bacterium]
MNKILIRAELSVLKTFASSSVLKTGNGDELTGLSRIIDSELNQYYVPYGWLPGIKIYKVYHILSTD